MEVAIQTCTDEATAAAIRDALRAVIGPIFASYQDKKTGKWLVAGPEKAVQAARLSFYKDYLEYPEFQHRKAESITCPFWAVKE